MSDDTFFVVYGAGFFLLLALLALALYRNRKSPRTSERIADQQRMLVDHQAEMLALQKQSVELQRAALAASERQAAALEKIAATKS